MELPSVTDPAKGIMAANNFINGNKRGSPHLLRVRIPNDSLAFDIFYDCHLPMKKISTPKVFDLQKWPLHINDNPVLQLG